MNDNFTINEIKSQITSWRAVYEDINNNKLVPIDQNCDKVILFGCGSSYNLAMSAAFFTNLYSSLEAIAVPSYEIVINTDAYLKKDKKYLLVGFSRSGETTETINVIRKTKNNKNIKSLVFSCKEKNSLVNLSDLHFICRKAEEQSIVMTCSFSAMLLAYTIMLLKNIKRFDTINEFKLLFDYLENRINFICEYFENFTEKNDFNSFFALGNGFNYGLAVEADLKMKEMSQTPSYSYHVFEFNHGPKSLLDKNSLCLFLTQEQNIVKELKIIIEEILRSKAKILIIGQKWENVMSLMEDADFSSLVRSFVNIPIFQILAYYQTIKKGLNPDKPRNLSYTTKI